MKRKHLFLCSLFFALVPCLVSGSTFAFFTADDAPDPAGFSAGGAEIRVKVKKQTISSRKGGQGTALEIECLPGAAEVSGSVTWDIENKGKSNVYLRADVLQAWKKDGQEISSPLWIPKIRLSQVHSWPLRNGFYFYQDRGPIILESGQHAQFHLPFTVRGKEGRYQLALTLEVQAVQSENNRERNGWPAD